MTDAVGDMLAVAVVCVLVFAFGCAGDCEIEEGWLESGLITLMDCEPSVRINRGPKDSFSRSPILAGSLFVVTASAV